MKQWANLDFLRSAAVLLVVYQHTLLYNHHLSWVGWSGLLGVCFFFVHTSLVLMWSLERDPHVGRFYIRRIFRIYPLWLVIFGLYIAFHIPASPEFAPAFGFHMPHGKEWLPELLLMTNIRIVPLVVGASWTLPLEVQMYLLLPFLFYFIRGAQKLWPLLLLDSFIILWDLAMYPMESSILPMVIPYFLGGVIAYRLSKTVRPTLPSWLFPLFIAALVIVGFQRSNYRISWLTCLILGLALPHFHQMTWKPLLRVSHEIAKYSYGIYLCHFIAIAVGSYYLANASIALRILGYTSTIILLPIAFYHLIENPLIRLGSKIARKIEPGAAPAINEQALQLEPAP